MGADARQEQCLLSSVHSRLDEAHRHWHACRDSYQDPYAFRSALNASIQAIRNVTWVLQKRKSALGGFADWYGPWQEVMRADPRMKWLQRSRNRVVKEGDLETLSSLRVHVVIDYYGAADEVVEALRGDITPDGSLTRDFTFPPHVSVNEALERLAASSIPKRLLAESTVTFTRAWRDRDQPEVELLEVLAHCYGLCSRIVSDAHGQFDSVQCREEVRAIDASCGGNLGPDGRLPCMVTSRHARSLSLRFEDGSANDGSIYWRVAPPDESEVTEAFRKEIPQAFTDLLVRGNLEGPPSGPIEALDTHASIAQHFLSTHPDHGWFVFFYVGNRQVEAMILEAIDAAGKRTLSQDVAERALSLRADGVVMIGEMWMAPVGLDEDGVALPARLHKDRSEALILHAETASGQVRDILIHFERSPNGQTRVEEPEEWDGLKFTFFEPLRQAWKFKGMGEEFA